MSKSISEDPNSVFSWQSTLLFCVVVVVVVLCKAKCRLQRATSVFSVSLHPALISSYTELCLTTTVGSLDYNVDEKNETVNPV